MTHSATRAFWGLSRLVLSVVLLPFIRLAATGPLPSEVRVRYRSGSLEMSHAPRGWFYGGEGQPRLLGRVGLDRSVPADQRAHSVCPCSLRERGRLAHGERDRPAASPCWCPGQLPISNHETGG